MFTGIKPIGRKAYGSIPHLPSSRIGSGDHHVTEGQARIATNKTRDKNDIVIVQEKLDGSNVAIVKLHGQIISLTRSGYLAKDSPYKQHHYFSKWVEHNKARFIQLLNEGERLSGEWLALAHGTRYQLQHEPFVAFDLFTNNNVRLSYDEFIRRVKSVDIISPWLLHIGSSFAIADALKLIEVSGHGAIDEVEGAVWRVERRGIVDFLCKYVHHYKQDGKYFAENNNGKDIWNCDITLFA